MVQDKIVTIILPYHDSIEVKLIGPCNILQMDIAPKTCLVGCDVEILRYRLLTIGIAGLLEPSFQHYFMALEQVIRKDAIDIGPHQLGSVILKHVLA